MSFTSFTKLAALALLVSTVAGHGVVTNITTGGITYPGYNPFQDPYMPVPPPRVVRPIPGNGFVTDLNSIDLQCGGYSEGGKVGSAPAKLHAGPVAAGSDVNIQWTLWPDSHKGALVTYMAKCPAAPGNCSTFMPTANDDVWFKVKEDGRMGTSEIWATAPLSDPKTFLKGYTYTIPPCLEAGTYLVRHEIIALFAAQFYPSCHQLNITGSGKSTGPTESVKNGSGNGTPVKVAFPGAYKLSDPGITYNVNAPSIYTPPGPKIFTCDGQSSGNSSSKVRSRFRR